MRSFTPDVVSDAELNLIRKVLMHYVGITSVEAAGEYVTAYGLSYDHLNALPSWVNGRAVQKMLHAGRQDLYVPRRL